MYCLYKYMCWNGHNKWKIYFKDIVYIVNVTPVTWNVHPWHNFFSFLVIVRVQIVWDVDQLPLFKTRNGYSLTYKWFVDFLFQSPKHFMVEHTTFFKPNSSRPTRDGDLKHTPQLNSESHMFQTDNFNKD